MSDFFVRSIGIVKYKLRRPTVSPEHWKVAVPATSEHHCPLRNGAVGDRRSERERHTIIKLVALGKAILFECPVIKKQ